MASFFIYYQPGAVDAASGTYNFGTAGDYTYDNTKIEFSGGQAQLGRSTPWWDTNYLYRKQLTVTASSTTAVATGNTLTLNADIATLVSDSKMRADHADLRIVYWSGSDNTNIDMDYLASGLGAIAATPSNAPVNSDVRFKAQANVSTSGTDTNYYLYYGYSGAATSSPQVLTNVYSYYNDFTTTSTWANAGLTQWEVNPDGSGRLKKLTTEATDKFSGDTSNGFAFGATGGWYSEVTSQRAVTTNTVGHAWVTSVPETTGYGLRTTTYGSSANDLEIWRLGAKLADGNTPVNYGTFTITTGVDYRSTMRVTYGTTCPTNTRVTAWIDGTTRADLTGINSGNCITTLYPGVHAWNSQPSWDDYKVWKVLDESISAGSEQTRYPNDDPTIQPATVLTFSTLSGFTETATKNGGEIKYVISNDGGSTWYYYNSGWTASDGTYAQASTADTVNTNVGTFSTGSGSFLFKAFLHSDGTQLVQLDNIAVGYNNIPSATLTNDFAEWDSANVTVNYKLIDADADTLNISQTGSSGLEYSTDNSSWSDATSGGGEGLTGLSSSASPGTSHTFVWDSATDLPTTEDASVYIRVRPNDGSANASAWTTSNAFGVDNVAPSAVGAPTFGTVTSNSIVVNKPTVVTEGGILNQWQARRDSVTALGSNATTTSSITNQGLTDNTQYTYDVQFSDLTNNTSTYGTVASKYTLADTPTNFSGTGSTNSVALSVDALTNNSVGSSGYYFAGGNHNSGWINTNSWTDTSLSCGNSYTYAVKYRNADGIETATVNTTVSTTNCPGGGGGLPPVPPAPPTPSSGNPGGNFGVVINNGTTQAVDRLVSLNLTAGANTVRMAISMDGTFNDAGQEDYTASKQWDLCSSYIGLVRRDTCPDGTYTVYVKYYSSGGLASELVFDSIILNTQVAAPVVTPPIVAPPPPVPPKPVTPVASKPKPPVVITKPPVTIPKPPLPAIPAPIVRPPTTAPQPQPAPVVTLPTPEVPTTPPVTPSANLPENILQPGQSFIESTAGQIILSRGIGDQTVTLIAGSKLKKEVKPDKPVTSIKVRVIFKKAAKVSLEKEIIQHFVPVAQADETWLISEYTLTDTNGDGIYEADIDMPWIAGEYILETVINYQDGSTDDSNTQLLIDPRGYVYEKYNGKELRVPDAEVTMYYKPQSQDDFKVWPGKDFDQTNPQHTDKTGEYNFLVPEGKYYFTVKASGYHEFKSQIFDVSKGDFVSQDVELKTSSAWDRKWFLIAAAFGMGILLGFIFRRRAKAK
ncbi:MAG: hypothetical protein C3F02_02280 [Parcubacteria group bacterium]|nr:MAG: hypothetical protein C3F02_02280 [Parcubacteria group bacterium]